MCVGVCVSASCVLCGVIVSDVTCGYVVFACINDNVGEGFCGSIYGREGVDVAIE